MSILKKEFSDIKSLKQFISHVLFLQKLLEDDFHLNKKEQIRMTSYSEKGEQKRDKGG